MKPKFVNKTEIKTKYQDQDQTQISKKTENPYYISTTLFDSLTDGRH